MVDADRRYKILEEKYQDLEAEHKKVQELNWEYQTRWFKMFGNLGGKNDLKWMIFQTQNAFSSFSKIDNNRFTVYNKLGIIDLNSIFSFINFIFINWYRNEI